MLFFELSIILEPTKISDLATQRKLIRALNSAEHKPHFMNFRGDAAIVYIIEAENYFEAHVKADSIISASVEGLLPEGMQLVKFNLSSQE